MTLSNTILNNHLTRPFKYYESVDSTNDIAKTWLVQGATTGSVIIANEQQKGRGRKGKIWYTPPNVALAISVILRPPDEYLPRINIIGALAVYDLVKHLGCDNIGIKWPNDVQVNGKKVSGILPEAIWESGGLMGVILGMGVNVRVEFKGSSLNDSAANLESIVGKTLDRAMLIEVLLKRVDLWYQRIASDALFITWKNRLNMLGKQVQVEGVEGLAVDVEPDGALLIQDHNKVVQRVLAGDVFVDDESSETE